LASDKPPTFAGENPKFLRLFVARSGRQVTNPTRRNWMTISGLRASMAQHVRRLKWSYTSRTSRTVAISDSSGARL
jgi:hypothetical protein